MLQFMTKERFVQAVNERRFVVMQRTNTKFEVYLIGSHEGGNGYMQHGLQCVMNPGTKDGHFKQTGGGYNKAMSCIEDVAYYIDNNEELDEGEEWKDFSCAKYFMSRQNYNTI